MATSVNSANSPVIPAELQRELMEGESVRWIGRPELKAATYSSIAEFCMFAAWLVFAIGSICHAYTAENGDKLAVTYVGFFFAVMGFFMLAHCSNLDLLFHGRTTTYCVTNRRLVVLVRGLFRRRVDSYTPNSLGRVSRLERKNGGGDLVLGQQLNRGRGGAYHLSDIRLRGLREVAKVEKLILTMQPADAASVREQDIGSDSGA